MHSMLAITPWPAPDPPSEAEVQRLLREKGLSPRARSNGLGDRWLRQVRQRLVGEVVAPGHSV